MSFIMQVTTASTAAASEAAAISGKKIVTFWSVIDESNQNGGWIINLLLLFMLGFTIFVFVERLLAMNKASNNQANFLSQIKGFLNQGDVSGARALCSATDSPSARMLEKGIARLGKSMDNISATIENTGKLEVMRLEQKLSGLATASGAAPMIGFLGTVIGMVIVFASLTAAPSISIEVIAPGIMTAMITTVEGLIVGIIGYVGYNYLCARVGKIVYQMENDAFEFMDIINEPTAK
jgi:biopolymer transport protein ExbB